MIFHARNKSVKYLNLPINVKLIERVTQFNFLGFILESNMSWNTHNNHISLKFQRQLVCYVESDKTEHGLIFNVHLFTQILW